MDFGTPLIRSSEISEVCDETRLGVGQYGIVYKGKCRGMSVAVKVPIKQNLSPKDYEALQKEVNIMRYFQFLN